MNKKSILLIIYSDISRHPRVLMELNALKDTYEFTCLGMGPKPGYNINYIGISEDDIGNEFLDVTFHFNYPLIFRKIISVFILLYKPVYRLLLKRQKQNPDYISTTLLKKLKNVKFDLIISHELLALPLAFKLAGNKPVVFNAHEYFPGLLTNDAYWLKEYKPVVDIICRKYLLKLKKMFVVTEGIAALYKQDFGISPLVITNAKPFCNLVPQQVNEKQIRIIHHGSSLPSRNLEVMAEMMNYLPENFTLYLMLFPADPVYHAEFIKKYSPARRIVFKDIVPTEKIPEEINQYDIGLFLLPPVNKNYELTLPNKFFEFIQARLAIAIGPSPEMEKYVRKYDLGIVAEDFSPVKMAQKISALSKEEIMYYKRQCHKSAPELSSVNEEEKIKQIVDSLVSRLHRI